MIYLVSYLRSTKEDTPCATVHLSKDLTSTYCGKVIGGAHWWNHGLAVDLGHMQTTCRGCLKWLA